MTHSRGGLGGKLVHPQKAKSARRGSERRRIGGRAGIHVRGYPGDMPGSIESIVYELRGENVDPLTGRADSSQSSRVFKSGWRGPMRHVICVVPRILVDGV